MGPRRALGFRVCIMHDACGLKCTMQTTGISHTGTKEVSEVYPAAVELLLVELELLGRMKEVGLKHHHAICLWAQCSRGRPAYAEQQCHWLRPQWRCTGRHHAELTGEQAGGARWRRGGQDLVRYGGVGVIGRLQQLVDYRLASVAVVNMEANVRGRRHMVDHQTARVGVQVRDSRGDP